MKPANALTASIADEAGARRARFYEPIKSEIQAREQTPTHNGGPQNFDPAPPPKYYALLTIYSQKAHFLKCNLRTLAGIYNVARLTPSIARRDQALRSHKIRTRSQSTSRRASGDPPSARLENRGSGHGIRTTPLETFGKNHTGTSDGFLMTGGYPAIADWRHTKETLSAGHVNFPTRITHVYASG